MKADNSSFLTVLRHFGRLSYWFVTGQFFNILQQFPIAETKIHHLRDVISLP